MKKNIVDKKQGFSNKLIGAHYKHFSMFLMVIVVGLLSLNLVSAWEFDNIKTYDKDTRTYTFKNSFAKIFPLDEIGKAQLKSEDVVRLYARKDIEQKVAEIKITLNEDYHYDIFRKISLYDINKNMNEFNRDVTLKYRVHVDNRTEPIYYTVCDDMDKNINCKSIRNGTRYFPIYEYRELGEKTNLSEGVYYISLWTEVKKGDNVEWIITGFGNNEWTEWATFKDEGLCNGLRLAYLLNETSGNAINSHFSGYFDLSVNGAGVTQGVNGVVDNGVRLSGDDDLVSSGNMSTVFFNSTGPNNRGTICFWANWTETGTKTQISLSNGVAQSIWQTLIRPSGGVELISDIGENSNCVTGELCTSCNDGKWHHICRTYNGTGFTSYIDGNIVHTLKNEDCTTAGQTPGTPFWFDGSDVLRIGDATTGNIDEFYIWNVSLTTSQIQTLNASRITQTTYDGCIDDDEPVITLNSPENRTNFTRDVRFNCSANDDKGLLNLTLKINIGNGFENNYTITNSSGTQLNLSLEKVVSFHSSSNQYYNWTCSATDTILQQGTGETRYFNITDILNINLEKPINNFNSSLSIVQFNCSANSSTSNIKNVTLNLGNGSSWTVTGDNQNLSLQRNISFVDGNYTWNCEAWNNISNTKISENRNFTVDATAPNINVTYPTGTISLEGTTLSSYLNWTYTEANPNSCWYSYNGSNFTTTCANLNTTFVLQSIANNLTFYMNDSFGNTNSSYREWDYLYVRASADKSSAIQGESVTFTLYLNNTGITSASATLTFNNTDYSPDTSVSETDYRKFQKTVTIPGSWGNNTGIDTIWNWSFNTNLLNGVTNDQTVTISSIIFEYCNASETPFLNITIYDAESPTSTVNSTIKSSWDIFSTGSGGGAIINRSFQDLTEQNRSWTLCLTPNNTNYTVSADIEFDSTGYSKNFHYLIDATYLANETKYLSLYLLNDSSATLTELQVEDGSHNALSDIYITIQSYDTGTDTFYNIGMAKTSEQGNDLAYLDWYDTLYKFILIQDGSVVLSTSPYKILETPQLFTITTETIDVFKKFEGFEYNLYFNNVTNNFVLTYAKPSGEVDEVCLRVTKRNQTNDYNVCLTCESSNSATVYCNLNGWGNGTFIATAYATGSSKFLDMITEIKNTNELIYDILGNVNGTVLAIIFSGIVMALFLISPLFGVIGLLLGMLGSYALGFQPMDVATFVGIVIMGGIVIWFIKK
jgi:hypothetical protein